MNKEVFLITIGTCSFLIFFLFVLTPWIAEIIHYKILPKLEPFTKLGKLKRKAKKINETSGWYIDYTYADWFNQKVSVYMPKEFYQNNLEGIKSIDFFWPDNYSGRKCYSTLLEIAIKYVEESIKPKQKIG